MPQLQNEQFRGFFVERMSIKNNWRQVTVPNTIRYKTEMTCENPNELR
ncbi:MAG: hypothetical protein Q4D54_02475 [Eubacteriales bacterium]|nr:hypothetical protein [Lachnospiraceae bacterium]MDO5126598.1 hypothetical protein [Eubacteriales bacterium]